MSERPMKFFMMKKEDAENRILRGINSKQHIEASRYEAGK